MAARNPEELRRKAEHAARVALMSNDHRTREALRALQRELEQEADELERCEGVERAPG